MRKVTKPFGVAWEKCENGHELHRLNVEAINIINASSY